MAPAPVSIIQPGDILLFQGKHFISRGIMWFTKSKYSHAAIAVSGTYLIEATGAGVEKNEIGPLISACDAFCIRRIPDLTVENAELMKVKAYSMLAEDSYDTLQLVSLGLYFSLRKLGLTWATLVANKPGRLICSEIVARCAACIPLKFASREKLVTPQTLYETAKLDTVCEVDMREMATI